MCQGVFAASLQPGFWGQPLGPALVSQLAWKRAWLGFLLVQAISWGLLSEPWFSVITATALAWHTSWSEWLEWKISKPLLCLALLLFVYNRIWGIFEGIIKHKTQCLALKTTLQHYLDPFAKDVSFFISVMGNLPALAVPVYDSLVLETCFSVIHLPRLGYEWQRHGTSVPVIH